MFNLEVKVHGTGIVVHLISTLDQIGSVKGSLELTPSLSQGVSHPVIVH